MQGEEAKNIPGESMTEEHYMDHDGNLISRKVKYSFVTFLTPEKHSSYEEKAACFYYLLACHIEIFPFLFKNRPLVGNQEGDSSGIYSHTR